MALNKMQEADLRIMSAVMKILSASFTVQDITDAGMMRLYNSLHGFEFTKTLDLLGDTNAPCESKSLIANSIHSYLCKHPLVQHGSYRVAGRIACGALPNVRNPKFGVFKSKGKNLTSLSVRLFLNSITDKDFIPYIHMSLDAYSLPFVKSLTRLKAAEEVNAACAEAAEKVKESIKCKPFLNVALHEKNRDFIKYVNDYNIPIDEAAPLAWIIGDMFYCVSIDAQGNPTVNKMSKDTFSMENVREDMRGIQKVVLRCVYPPNVVRIL